MTALSLADVAAQWIEDVRNRPLVATCSACGAGLTEAPASGVCGSCQDDARQLRYERRLAVVATRESIPARYRWAQFDSPELARRVQDATAIARLKAEAQSFERVTLHGPAGIGKTVLSACLLDARAREGAHGYFLDGFTLAHARSRARLGGEAPEVESALTARVCVIDDLGSEPNVGSSAVSEVIHKRHAANLATVITTWMTPAEVKARYGDGIARRCFEGALVVGLTPRRGAK
jgi:DNA replication protein DnaC